MQCQFCNHSFNISTHLPIINLNGETQCQKCYLKSTNNTQLQQSHDGIISFKSDEQPKVNKELIKLMGRCPAHIEQKLTLFDVNSRKRRCPKCIIFCKDKQKYENCTFVEIDDQQHKLNDVLIENVKLLEQNITKIQSTLLKKISMEKQDAIKKMNQTLEKQYKKYQKDLEKAYMKQKQRILSIIQEAWFSNTLPYNMALFDEIRIKLAQINSFQKVSSQEKFNKIAEAIQMQQKAKQMQKVLFKETNHASKKLINIVQRYSCNIKCSIMEVGSEASVNQQKSKAIDHKFEEQILIDALCDKEEAGYIDFSLDLSRSTIKSLPSQASTERTSMTCTSKSITYSAETKNKSVLVASNINELNKIDTQIREVAINCSEISNTDAKKVLGLVSKSFTKILDLSGNKITSLFVKELNKSNIGKYLKTIKLSKNQIDLKEASILKKIEQLKNQGVNIVI